MDNMPPGLADRSQTGGGSSNLSSFRRLSSTRPVSSGNNVDGSSPGSHFQTVVVIVHKDENGYGMKVSGDNPVYVQSVKEGGAAEKAGLQCGDMIIKVNGENVTQSTHLQVVSLIRASTHVELTVHQNSRNQPSRTSIACMTSPSSHSRMLHSHSSGSRGGERITGPQPVDVEKLRQFETQRVHTFRLMLEKEQLFVDSLRSKLARCTDPQSGSKIQQDLNGAIRRVSTLQEELKNSIGQIEHSYALSQLISPINPFPIHTILEGECVDEIPPPLPKRNRSFHSLNSHRSPVGVGPPLPPRCNNFHVPSNNDAASLPNTTLIGMGDAGPFQMSPHTMSLGHHRTKSNPDPLGPQSHAQNMSPSEASKKLIASESLQDIYKRSKSHLGSCDVDSPHESPSGTPPPPYRDEGNPTDDDVQLRFHGDQTPDISPLRGNVAPHGSTPILQNIMSMEDEDMNDDQELGHPENHEPFKSLAKLWQHHAHLAVFMNYLLCNSDPSSLLFYLVTDLYKEGNGKEMKKWAYEIHSSFLVPGAPLRLNNVDENFACEIDNVLLKESDKEEILRRIFWKTRVKAKEELNEQLADFQQKLTAGLGTLFGPSDASLDESIHDKNKEIKIVESILLPKMESYMEDIEKDNVDMRRFTTAAALGTVLGKVFGLRGPHASSILERCPTFISKDKSLKAKLLIGKSRKLTVKGHQFVAHQYYTVTYCNHCQLIIWGIGPQGYQCTNCNLNVHRHNCVRVVEENCPGPIMKKDRGDNRISKLMEKIRPEREARRKPSSLHVNQSDRGKKHIEDKDESYSANDSDIAGDRAGLGLKVSEKRPDIVRENEEKSHNDDDGGKEDNVCADSHNTTKGKNSATNINRSESYRERIPQKKVREKRKTSDPNVSKTSDVDLDAQGLSYKTNSGSSSNSSLSARSLDSPSNPLDMVTATQQRVQEAVTVTLTSNNTLPVLDDSDNEADIDPPDWTKGVDENVLKSLSSREKKRQEVINELFQTEKSHVTRLKVLDQIFLKPMQEYQILPADQLHLLFQNLEEMLDIHSRFNSAMKAKKKESPLVGDISHILLAMFDGAEGENFQRAAAVFCAKQQIALEQLKERRKKDTKLNNFLTEAEGNAMCRRLQLKDMLPTVMQRLTKYPMLFENLAKYSQSYPEEEKLILKAVELSKAILNHVNQAVKAAEDHQRLEDIQRRLDKTAFEKVDHPMTNEFRNLDLRTHKLIHEGSLSWRIGKEKKSIDIYVLLLHDIIILLQKQDEKFVLKFYNMNTSSLLSPIVKVSSVLVRDDASDKSILYLVNTPQTNAQMYHLVASSPSEKIKKSLSFDKAPMIRIDGTQRRCSLAYGFLPYITEKYPMQLNSQKSACKGERKGALVLLGSELKERRESIVQRWLRHISEAADAYKNKDHFGKNRRLDLNVSSQQSPPDSESTEEASEKNKELDDTNDNEPLKGTNELETSGTSQDGSESNQSNDSSRTSVTTATPQTSPSTAGHSDVAEEGKKSAELSPPHRTSVEPLRLSTVENPLINPSEVIVLQKPVLTAERVLTPLEQLRLKVEAVKKAQSEQEQLVAEILHVPKGEFETIADIAAEPSTDKEATELILAALNQAKHLDAVISDSLNLSEEETVALTSDVAGVSPRCGRRKYRLPELPTHKLQGISYCWKSQMTQLLKKIKEYDEERERLRRELQRSRELNHFLHEMHRKSPKGEACCQVPEDMVEESSDLTPEHVTQIDTAAEEYASNELLQESSENRDGNSDVVNEVFVDALTGDTETVENVGEMDVQNESVAENEIA